MIGLNITRLALYLLLGIVFLYDIPLRYWGLPALILYDWPWFIYIGVLRFPSGGSGGLTIAKPQPNMQEASIAKPKETVWQ